MKIDSLTIAFENLTRKIFFSLGRFNARRPYTVIFITLAVSIVFIAGLRRIDELRENRTEELWVPQDSDAFKDRDLLESTFGQEPDFVRILVEQKGDGSILNREALLELAKLEETILTTEVDKNGESWSYRKLCYPTAPIGAVVCRNTTVLAFFGYDTNNIPTDPAEIVQIVQGSIPGVFTDSIIGGIEYNDQNMIESARAFLSTYYLSPNTEARRDGQHDNDDEWLEASEAWQDEWLTVIKDEGETTQVVDTHRFARVTGDREVARAAGSANSLVAISIGLIFLFLAISFGSTDPVKSNVLLAILGVCTVLLAFGAGLGLSLWFGVKFTPISVVIIFLLLGMGVANFVILAENYDRTDSYQSIEERNAQALSHAGAFVTLTNSTTIIAFLVGSNSGFPAVYHFSLGAAIIITVNYVYNVTLFNALMVLSARRVGDQRADCFPCFKVRSNGLTETLSTEPSSDGPLDHFIHNVMAPQIPKKKYRITILVLFGCLFILGAYGFTQLNEGLDLQDVVPDDSYYTEFFSLINKYFDAYGAQLSFLLGSFEYHDQGNQQLMQSFERDIEALESIADLPVSSPWDYYNQYLDACIEYGCMIPGGFCQHPDYPADGCLTARATEKSYLAYLAWFLRQEVDGLSASIFLYDLVLEGEDELNPERVIASRFKTTHKATLTTSQQLVDALDETREVTENYYDQLGTVPFALEYLVWDSFSYVRSECIRNLFVSFFCVFVILLLLLHPGAAFIVVCIIAMMDLLIMAWIPTVGLELNSVTTICIVMSVGIAVDYSAHIAHSFLVHTGSKTERARKAVDEMGRAIVSGAAATGLGIVMLAVAPTAVNRTFFKMMGGIVAVGAIHGLILLPVILAFVGPKTSSAESHSGESDPLLNKAASVN